MGKKLSTPRDHNQPPWPQRPNPGQDPRQGSGYPPQQAGNPFAQQPTQWAGQPQAQPGQPPAQYGQPGQYGQPPAQYAQPHGQYGQAPGQYGQAPGQYGQPAPPATSKKKGSKSKPFLIAGAVVGVLLLVVIAVVVLSTNKDSKKVAVSDVQTQVQEVLLDRITGYSSGDITDVKCNNGQDPTVKKGGSFTCNVSVRGKQHQLTVTFEDADGTYEVGLPQLDGGK